MRPTTPNYDFTRQATPSSPPPTPTTAAAFSFKNRRNGVMYSKAHLPPEDGTITPNGNGPNFFYTPSNRPADLSPRSSSPINSTQEPSSAGNSRRSSISETNLPTIGASPQRRKSVLAKGNFTVEEIDYEDWDSDDDDVIRPHQYEDADSERTMSVKSVSHNELDPHIVDEFQSLNCDAEDEREAWLQAEKIKRRRRRRSSASVQKRTLSQSIGSDTDDEDLQPVTFDANDAGSSARRLRRKTNRTSLVFDDPPPRIDEEDEDEIVEMQQGEHGYDYAMRELPYYIQMEVDGTSEE